MHKTKIYIYIYINGCKWVKVLKPSDIGLVYPMVESGCTVAQFMLLLTYENIISKGLKMKLKLMEIVQQLKYIDLDKMKKVLEEKKGIRDWAYIIHDKDINEKGELKEPHIHLALRFHDPYDTKHVAQWFEVKENYVCKVKGKWADMLKYLTHKNALDKHQYDDEDVKSNFDFKSVIEKAEKNKNKNARKEEIINLIASGEIREFNYYDYITAVEFSTYSKAINDAFKYRTDKLITEGKRKMECIFITGAPGSGKTIYAKKIADDKGLSYFVSSSTNDIMDGYKGQDVIILDDLRPQSMDLVDLLKLLDNNTSSTVKSRFKNKFIECKMIIITTVLAIEHFYNDIKGAEHEPIEQFKRRCKTYVTLEGKHMHVSGYDISLKDYGKVYTIKNPVWEIVSCSQRNDYEMFEDMINVLGIDIEELQEDLKDLKSDDYWKK